MPRAHIDYRDDAYRRTFTYRLVDRRAVLAAWLWCAIGGLAVGVGTAVALAVAGRLDTGGQSFRAVLVLAALAAALALYLLVYRRAARHAVLRVSFDLNRLAVGVCQPGAGGRWRWHALDDVTEFRLSENEQAGCALMMDTVRGPVRLVTVHSACDEQSGLPHLAGRLTAHLHTLYAPPDDLPDVPHPASLSFSPLPDQADGALWPMERDG